MQTTLADINTLASEKPTDKLLPPKQKRVEVEAAATQHQERKKKKEKKI